MCPLSKTFVADLVSMHSSIVMAELSSAAVAATPVAATVVAVMAVAVTVVGVSATAVVPAKVVLAVSEMLVRWRSLTALVVATMGAAHSNLWDLCVADHEDAWLLAPPCSLETFSSRFGRKEKKYSSL